MFRNFERSLLERELTDDNIEAALVAYLERLDVLGDLRIAGTFQERKNARGTTMPAVDRLHVFARTRGQPRTYFYRVRVDSAYWTPWEEVLSRSKARG